MTPRAFRPALLALLLSAALAHGEVRDAAAADRTGGAIRVLALYYHADW